MLKILLYFAMVAPCLALSITGRSSPSLGSVDRVSFDAAFVDPALESLKNCSAAKLDIFFNDRYITTHSLDFISASIEASEHCAGAVYNITPIAPMGETRKGAEERASELTYILGEYGIEPEISPIRTEDHFDNLSKNGRNVIVTVTFNESFRDEA